MTVPMCIYWGVIFSFFKQRLTLKKLACKKLHEHHDSVG